MSSLLSFTQAGLVTAAKSALLAATLVGVTKLFIKSNSTLCNKETEKGMIFLGASTIAGYTAICMALTDNNINGPVAFYTSSLLTSVLIDKFT